MSVNSPTSGGKPRRDNSAQTTATAANFLRALFGNAPEGFHVLVWTLRDTKSRWLPVAGLSDAASVLVPLARQDAGNVYCGVSLFPADLGPDKRGEAAQSAGIVGLWLDV